MMPRNAEKEPKSHPVGPGDASGDKKEDVEKKKPRKYGNYNRRGRFIGKNRYSGTERTTRPYKQRRRFEVGDRLKEVDLGITEYVGDTEGFTGTIKERFSDFLVNEIGMDGKIAKLNNTDIPPEPEELESIEDLKKKVPEDVWNQLEKINENSDIEIDVTTFDKVQRRNIHNIVKKLSTIVSETKDVGDKKIMVFTKHYAKDHKAHDNRKDWSARGGDYCYFVLHKRNVDTMDALNQISRVLRLKPTIFSYAGTKDRRASTSQWISVKKMNPKRIMDAARIVRGVYVGNFKFEKETLKLGKLEGNRFTLTLRNVTASDETIEKGMQSLKDKGFINYYGLQRFGSIPSIPTFEIGKALLQGKWEEAANLILKPREGEQDLDLAEARKVYQETQDARAAYQKITRHDKIEAKLLWGLNISGQKNIQGALDSIPRNTRLMYIHSYQSIVWNKIVSKRIKELGLQPVVGDLVYENPDSKDDIEEVHEVNEEPSSDEAEASKKTVDKNEVGATNKEKQEPKAEQKHGEKNERERSLPKVKILTQEDLSNYTICDIVIPLPGWKVTYPTYAKPWFEEFLEKDGLTDLKQDNMKYSLSGSYRKIVQKPEDVNWKILHYANKIEDLTLSDVDEMRGTSPPKNNPDGQFKALVIELTLKPSSYATMVLREVLKCDTSSKTHAAQSASFHAAHKQENGSTSKSDIDHSTEDESCEKKPNLNLSSILDDSRNGVKDVSETIAMGISHKHEIDLINDSGIDYGNITGIGEVCN